MKHNESFELLAPLALDALEDDVRVEVDEHVLVCRRCQSELDGLRDVAAAMGTTVLAPPDDLWERIASRLYERDGSDASTLPELALGGMIVPISAASPKAVLSRRVRAVMVTVSLAAAAAIIALGINLGSAHGQITNLQNALSQRSDSAVVTALTTPGHKLVTLRTAANHEVAKFVILPSGVGYLVSASMPTLTSGKTYQLWGIVNGSPVSIGVMGSSPTQAAFTLASSPGPSALAVTVEPAGGSLTPAKAVVAQGAV